MTKLQTQVRAEIGWLWQKEESNDVQTSSGSVRFRTNQTDTTEERIEGVWYKCEQPLTSGSSVIYELDYLTRNALGGTLDIGFLDVRAIVIACKSGGALIVSPGETSGWKAPWNDTDGQTLIPSGGCAMFCSGASPWAISLLNNKLKLTASGGDCVFNIAVVGKIANRETTASSSSASSASTGSSSVASSTAASSYTSSSASSSTGSI